MRYIDIVRESVFYQGDFSAEYAPTPEYLMVLENPTKGELQRLFKIAVKLPYSTGIELRAILGNDLYIWDASVASHDSIKKKFGFQGMHLYFFQGYFKMDDYFLRDPDMKAEAIAEISDHPMIKRLYGEVTFTTTPDHDSCFVSAKKARTLA